MTNITNDDILAVLTGQAPVAKVDVLKDIVASDAHVPSTDDDKAAAVVEGKAPQEPKADSQAEVEKRVTILKAITAQDAVFAKGDANLYVSRPLTEGSAKRLAEWAAAQGIKNVVPPELMHVTVAHSKAEVDTGKLQALPTLLDVDTESRWLTGLGKDGKALVMMFRQPDLSARHKEFAAAGASWDFPSYIPHITLSYDTEDKQPQEFGFDPAPDMPLQLAAEVFQRSNDNWTKDHSLTKADDGSFEFTVDVKKVVPDQQMIFGWLSVASANGIEIIDKQGDIIPIVELEKAAYEFVLYSRTHGEMHSKIGTGRLVESMVFTPEKAVAGIMAKNEKGEAIMGWWGGFRVDDPGTWARHKSGALPEFSIGGKATPVPT